MPLKVEVTFSRKDSLTWFQNFCFQYWTRCVPLQITIPKLVGSCYREPFSRAGGYGVLLQASGQEVNKKNKFIDGTKVGSPRQP